MTAPLADALPASLDIVAQLKAERPPLEFVLPGLLRGTVGGLISPGGVGKSFWALGAALAIAEQPTLDLTGLAPAAGRVLFLSAEDPEVVVANRLEALNRHLRLTKFAQLDYRCCLGLAIDLMDDGWFAQIREAAANCRLVIIDTLTRFHNLDENAAHDMKRLLGRLEQLGKETGAAILYLHHTSKTAALSGQQHQQQAARGSSVLADNARWMAFMALMTEGEAKQFGVAPERRERYVRWNISKQNYGPAKADVWFCRDESGVLLPVALTRVSRQQQRQQVQNPAPVAAEPTVVPPVLPTAKNKHGGQW